MVSNIQSYQKRLTTIFSRQEGKRRGSNHTGKQEESLHNKKLPIFNYQISEETAYIENIRNNSDDGKVRIFLNLESLEVYSKLKPLRTCKLPSVENWEGDNPKLECFLQSYTKDFVNLVSKYENANKGHLKAPVMLPTDFPIYEVDRETMIPSPDDVADDWETRNFERISPDPLLTGLLNNLSTEAEEIQSSKMRQKSREDKIFSLYEKQEYDKQIELKPIVEYPHEFVGRSFQVQIKSFSIDPVLEPVFGQICLYDFRNRRKISENFYFDVNDLKSDTAQRSFFERYPRAKGCILHVTHPSDIYLIIRIEKILQQGDVNEVADSYLKEDKNRAKLKSQIEWSSQKLIRYKMPFGMVALELNKIMNSGLGHPFHSSSSIDNSFASRNSSVKLGKTMPSKKNSGDTVSIKSFGRSISKDTSVLQGTNLEEEEFDRLYSQMQPCQTHIQYLYRWDNEKFTDEDLFKWLSDLRKNNIQHKKLKFINCQINLEIKPVNELTSQELILSPEHQLLNNRAQQLQQQPHQESNMDNKRLLVDVLEFSPERTFLPHVIYRNLLYIYPKSVNFSSRPTNLRNITIKIQLVLTDGDKMKVLPLIFSKDTLNYLDTEAYTKVLYHNKTPEFNDEIKIKLPAVVTDEYVILFTFYHISCKPNKKTDNNSIETIIGYSWLPVLDNKNCLKLAEHNLMVSINRPKAAESLTKPDLSNNLENVRWLENHKELFRVVTMPISTVHCEDLYIENFNNTVSQLKMIFRAENNNQGPEIERIISKLMLHSENLERCQSDSLIQFSSIIFDNLLYLATEPRLILKISNNVDKNTDKGRYFLLILANLVNHITNCCTNRHRNLNRNSVLSTYVLYSACLPNYMEGQKLRFTGDQEDKNNFFHVALLSAIKNCMDGNMGNKFFENLWFFLELLVRAMKEYFEERKEYETINKVRQESRVFAKQFQSDLEHLFTRVMQYIDRLIRDNKEATGNITCSNIFRQCQFVVRNLALFCNDLIVLLDTNFIKTLILDFTFYVNSKVGLDNQLNVKLYVLLKLEFLRIVSSSEYFFYINNIDVIRLKVSNSVNRNSAFLIDLILMEVKASLLSNDDDIQTSVSYLIWNLLASHESDSRYVERLTQSNIAEMYLPYLKVLYDCISLLHRPSTGSSASYSLSTGPAGVVNTANNFKHFSPFSDPFENVTFNSDYSNGTDNTSISSLGVAGASDGLSAFSPEKNTISDGVCDPKNLRHLLLSVLWILKTLSEKKFIIYLQKLSSKDMRTLMYLLYLTVVSFEYKGSKESSSSKKNGSFHSSSVDLDNNFDNEGKFNSNTKLFLLNSNDLVLFGKLCQEVVFIILDTLQIMLKIFEKSPNSNLVTINAFKIVIKAMSLNQSVAAMQSILAFQRYLIKKYYALIFEEAIDLSGDLCRCLFNLLSSDMKEIRSHAVASLYMLMRFNFEHETTFARVKLQMTTAFSRFVYENNVPPERRAVQLNINRSLRTLMSYSSVDRQLHEELIVNGHRRDEHKSENGLLSDQKQFCRFANQVEELAKNLESILADTVKMRRYYDDPQMQIDLMSRIAKSYQNSPDLRLAWLQFMGNKHKDVHEAEAGMCYAHCSALVAEYLGMKEPAHYLPVGCVQLADALGPNLLKESAISDDTVGPDEDGVCCDGLFCQNGFIKLVRLAAEHFKHAEMFELIPALYRIIIPIYEHRRDYIKLSQLHSEIKEAYDRINKVNRIFATYFRVGFYGSKANEMDGQEYIYKEAPFSKLPEVSHKLEAFYSNRFDKDSVVIIKDSNTVILDELDPDKLYIQITYVEPYFEITELSRRQTAFEQNYNLKKFVYSTPYTLTGKPHGDIKSQYKRKTVLITESAFPYIKTRIRIVRKLNFELTPIEVALDDLTRKVEQLSAALAQKPLDAKYLQMMLQGSIGATVNQGPLELAQSFLSQDDSRLLGVNYNKLKMCFKHFLRNCREGLSKNKDLITSDQLEYHRELEKNYEFLFKELNPLLNFV